jgi:hypothetical protein
MPQYAGPHNLAASIREHGGLEGLSTWLGEHDPDATTIESEANDNRLCKPIGFWRQLWTRLHRNAPN